VTKPRALVTGVTGQDGSYLAELLLDEGYEVWGVARHVEADAARNLEGVLDRLQLRAVDVSEPGAMHAMIEQVRPQQVYHLAGPTFVPDSWERPSDTVQAIAGATADLLHAVQGLDPEIRVYVASSGQIFGAAAESPQNELTPCRPQNPYAVAKLAAHELVGAFRSRAGLHACSGITYNHESPRRPERFVTRKVTRGAAAIKLGLRSELTLGDLDTVRDWSHAKDVVRGAWMMVQAPRADDYVLASGVGRTVADLVGTAFGCVGLDPAEHIRTDPDLLRRGEQTPLVGDASKAREGLGWKPEVGFEELIEEMVRADLEELAPTSA
jgi:GDPmannose 4,6-dehydratase